MKLLPLLFIITILSIRCQSQHSSKSERDKKEMVVGGPCEGCEAIYESPVPFEQLSFTTCLADWNDRGPKLVVSGIVYQPDGSTPAPGVVVYVYHTNQQGVYPNKTNDPDIQLEGWGKRHGFLRGWMKTNEKGEYKFYTLQPASYPNSNAPKHIHVTLKEPGKTEYYIDEYLFDEDPFLTTAERKKQAGRGGNGILSLEEKEGVLYGERNIYLGRNIPGYPPDKKTGLQSGLEPGDNCPAFDPLHLTGADSGKHVCPMCKYGYGQGIMLWFNHTHFNEMNEFARTLETEMIKRGEKKLRVFLVYMNTALTENESVKKQTIQHWCETEGFKHVAVLQVPSDTDPETAGLYKINEDAINTVFVYKKRKIAAKWVNMDYSPGSLKKMMNYFEE